MNSCRGSTLIELLIAITLVSLLSMGMLFSIRVGINTLDATNRRVLMNRRTVGAQRILESQVAGFLPTTVRCGGLHAPPGTPAKTPFFQGEPDVMRFVTTYSLREAGRGYPRVLEVFVGPGSNGRGVRLLANEHLFTGPVGAGIFCAPGPPGGAPGVVSWRPVEQGSGSFVLADQLASARFSYLMPGLRDQPDVWVPRWLKPEIWPLAVRIEMAALEHSPGRIAPLTFTSRIHITRKPLELNP